MKFFAGVLLGLLLAGPEEPDITYNTTEVNRYRVAVQNSEPVIYNPVPLQVDVIDGQEWCVIELLGGPGADWDASDVLAVLDEAWLDYDGPCDMLEVEKDGEMRDVQSSD